MSTNRLRLSVIAGLVLALIAAVSATMTPAGALAPGAAITVSSSLNPSVHGQNVVLRAVVSDASTPRSLLTGTATFVDGAFVLGTAPVRNGTASLGTRLLAAGDHSISVTFAPADGGGDVLSTAPLLQHVSAADTTISVASSKPTANYGDGGKITATVRAVAPGAGTPTGTVDFVVDGDLYWTSLLDANGRATLLLSDLYPSFFPGPHEITATYSGDADNNPSATTTALVQTLVGISEAPVSSITLDSRGRPSFQPRSFTLSSLNPVGCNVTLTNTTADSIVLLYGTPGSWKRLPGGVIPAGASRGVGVGLADFTGYFTAVGAANYVKIHCV